MVQNVTPKQVWEALASHPEARLVDVRTDYEVVAYRDSRPGADRQAASADLLGRWAPSMMVNEGFVDDLAAAGLKPDDHIYFLCRSGVRSVAAAEAATEAGYKHAFNILDGFEGPPNGQGARGMIAGWQADGLPWKKD